MSKLCATMFKLSDITSGGVFGLASLAVSLSFFVPPVSLILAAIIHGLSLGDWGFLYLVVFIGLNFFTFKHKLGALLGHTVLILLLAVLGSGFSYLYTALFLIYLLPYILVYIEATKHNKSSNTDTARRTVPVLEALCLRMTVDTKQPITHCTLRVTLNRNSMGYGTGVRPNHNFPGRSYSVIGQLDFIEKDWLCPGESCEAKGHFLIPVEDTVDFVPGFKWDICEVKKVTGTAELIELNKTE